MFVALVSLVLPLFFIMTVDIAAYFDGCCFSPLVLGVLAKGLFGSTAFCIGSNYPQVYSNQVGACSIGSFCFWRINLCTSGRIRSICGDVRFVCFLCVCVFVL